MAYLKFMCGCRFKIVGDDSPGEIRAEALSKLPRVDISLNPHEPHSLHRASLTCEAVWDLFAKGATKGIFQLEKHLGKQWSQKAKPKNLEDLGALVALLRPGCLRAMSGDPPKSMTQRYVDRKHGTEEVTYLHKAIAQALETTYGVLVYQEQAMRIAELVAAFNKQDADVLRKAIGKKKADIMAQVEKDFISKAETAGIITVDEAKEIFSWIRESQKYSFNKSHAVAYGLDSYWSAYIKAHFPLSFYGAWILGANWKNADKYDEIAELVNDAKLSNIEVKTPQLPYITEQTDVINDEYVQFGMTEVKGIGLTTVHKVYDALKELEVQIGKPVLDWTWIEYLIFATDKISKKVNEALISVGALDYMGGTRTKKLYEYAQYQKLSGKEPQWLIDNFPAKKWTNIKDALLDLAPVKVRKAGVQIAGGGTSTKGREDMVRGIIYLLDNPTEKLEDSLDWIATTEEKFLGTPVSAFKVDGCIEAANANSSCKDVLAGKKGYLILGVEVVKVDELTTKGGKNPGSKMAKLLIRDSSCTIEAVVFPKEWAVLNSVLYAGNTALVQGDVKRDGGFFIQKAKEIS